MKLALGIAIMLCLWLGASGRSGAQKLGAQKLVAQRPQASLGRFQQNRSEVAFEALTDANGLANPVVTAFAEDGDGFLWVGTQSGLQRWDGYRFWDYKTRLGDPNSLPDNLIQTLYTDPQGRLWVGTSAGGLAQYDRTNDRFIQYKSSPGDLSRVNVDAITGDGGHGLWLGTDTGLSHLDIDSGGFARPELAAPDGSHARARGVKALLRTADGTLWVGTELGLERTPTKDGRSGVFERVPLPDFNDGSGGVDTLFSDHRGRLWVGTQQGAYVLDGASGRGATAKGLAAKGLTAKGLGSEFLATGRILSIAETSQGEIWLGTQDEGILAVTGGAAADSWEVRRISHEASLATSLANDWVQSLYLGRSGIMWVATHRWVDFLDTAPKSVFTFLVGAAKTGQGNASGDADVYSMLTRPDGSIWLGLTKHGIDILDSTGRRIGAIPTGAAQGAAANHEAGRGASKPGGGPDSRGKEGVLPEGTVGGLTEAGDGTVYICTQQGLYRTVQPNAARQRGTSDGAGSDAPRVPTSVTRVPIGAAASAGLAQMLVIRDKLWIAGSNGVWTFDPANPKREAQRPRMQQPLTDQRVSVMLEGQGETLWVGTQNGLNGLNMETGAVETILPDPVDGSALGAGLISALLEDKKGRLWVGTFSGGIDVLERHDANGRARFHRIIDGLPNDNIDMLLQAPDGKIWVSTDGGLAVVDPETFEIRVLGRAEGATIAAYWNSVGAVTAAGDLLFGGIGGLSVVRPTLVKPWTYEPPLVVTAGRIGTVDVPISRFNSGPDVYPIWIPPDHNNLTVEFAALDYTAPERNRYEYKLEGFDKDWIAAGPTRRVARYTNLPPGNYVLLLRGSNRDGVWAPTRHIRVLVLPAWYQTVWFRLLAVLATLFLLVGIFLMATAYLRRQQRELERQVAVRTAELRQITDELQASQQKLEHMAYTDSLTGLPNRRMFNEHFRRLSALKRRQGGTFALMLLDLDDFKEINDTHGHDAGDAVLKEMARRLSALVRESDCFARLGGDEFGLLLAESPDLEGTEMVCQKVIESFTMPVDFDGLELKTSSSIGIALYPEDGDAQDTLYKAADLALYQAKRRGGNGCRWSEREPSATQFQ